MDLDANDYFTRMMRQTQQVVEPEPWANARRSCKAAVAHLVLAERAIDARDDSALANAMADLKDDAEEILYYARGGQ